MRKYTGTRPKKRTGSSFKINKKLLITICIAVAAVLVCIAVIGGIAVQKGFEASTLRTSDTIRVGIRTDVEGFGSLDENGNIVGFDRDYIDAILKELIGDQQKVYEYYALSSQDAAGAIKYDNVDIALGLLTSDTDKTKGFPLTVPYYTDSVVAVTTADSRLEKLSNMEGGKIGILSNAIASADFAEYIEQKKMDYNTKDILRYADYESIRMDLDAGRVNAVVMPQAIAKQFVKEGYRMLAEPLYSVGYSILLPIGQDAVVAEMNRVIETFDKDGTTQTLVNKWGL
ncbi:MAG: transporter substrate-binding domain-containing protein [Christensenella sp.]|uniref:substrate-binding periplasmic protein n=1 Tax=Christensenella sp. TaxID=1935934 RepID=UPI002B1FCD63|nr:transporter substrate-binding domain-containing protein [Christensenella sp.]MEA5003109.1 transporter substrate-binding domain-containing protein [Christensenella sp.]